MNSIPSGTAYYMTVGCIDIQLNEFVFSFILGRPRSSMVPFYTYFRLEAGCTYVIVIKDAIS